MQIFAFSESPHFFVPFLMHSIFLMVERKPVLYIAQVWQFLNNVPLTEPRIIAWDHVRLWDFVSSDEGVGMLLTCE